MEQINCTVCANAQCIYNITYADSSGFTAAVYVDDVSLGGLTATGQIFGAITYEHNGGQPFEPRHVDGIMVGCVSFRNLAQS